MKTKVSVMHSAHLDLFWMGAQDRCLAWGSRILDDVIRLASEDRDFHFMIETVRFVEYYLHLYPEKRQTLRELIVSGQIEVGADYVDKLESSHDGESAIRNILHGKRLLKELLDIDTALSFHPDLPGTAEQMPQILRKCGVKYYLAARGFRMGARFKWNGLDGKPIMYYNFPIHYSYYNLEEIFDNIGKVQAAVSSRDIAVCCSAGDLGAADTFTHKGVRVNLRSHIREMSEAYPDLDIRLSGILPALESMDDADLPSMDGENPSRWGHTTSALHVPMSMLDKEASAALMDAEKYSALCDMLSVPVAELKYDRHVLAHTGAAGGGRRYFELEKKAPATNDEYLKAAWEYLLVTQDHNHGGVEGSQAEFDRFAYKNGALGIARRIRDAALANISALIKADEPSVAVFNSMNWVRGGKVKLPDGLLTDISDNRYAAVDKNGQRAPIVCRDGAFMFEADGVPSVGYKAYRIEKIEGENASFGASAADVRSTEDELVLLNRFYEVAVCRKTGVVKRIFDRECRREIVGGDRFSAINAYEDMTVSAADNIADKPLIDESVRHVRRVGIKYSDAYETCVEVVAELINNKIAYEIALSNRRKEIRISPVFYWRPTPNTQVKMNLDLSFASERLVYGVPYGVQTFGNAFEENLTFKDDEINGALYARYREAEKWFAAESNGFGVCIASNIGSYDFDGQQVCSTMMRNVKSVGDYSFDFVNKGEFRYHYIITSYAGSWEDGAYRKGWELAQPLHAAPIPPDSGGTLPAEHSFLSAGPAGILTVLAKAETGGGYIARIFNPTSRRESLEWQSSADIAARSAVDFRETETGEPIGTLEPYEIKTVRFE